MIRLYSNENFPIPAVEELRNLGYDSINTSRDWQRNASIPR